MSKVEKSTVFVKKKKHTFDSDFLVAPWGRRAKNSHSQLRKWEFYLHNRSCEFLDLSPREATKKFGIKCASLLTQTVLVSTVTILVTNISPIQMKENKLC